MEGLSPLEHDVNTVELHISATAINHWKNLFIIIVFYLVLRRVLQLTVATFLRVLVELGLEIVGYSLLHYLATHRQRFYIAVGTGT